MVLCEWVFPMKWSQAHFLWSAAFPEAIYRKRDSAHQDLAFFLEGILLLSAEKRVKQEPVPYTHENVTFLKRRFTAFDAKKKVTQEPLPYMGENISAVRLAFMA